MLLAHRLRAIREAKNLSQGDIEERSGLKRSYILRVENGHTGPSVETLEKLARALQVPLYQLFFEGDEPHKLRRLPPTAKPSERLLTERRRRLLLALAQGMARGTGRTRS
jgi:transcriptional regulator with XRE-family HTH domain